MEIIHISDAGEYEPGDPPPTGYGAWHEWAKIQHSSGLRQTTCPDCSKWKFPQEFSNVMRYCVEGQARRDIAAGVEPTRTKQAICNDCANRTTPNRPEGQE